MATRSRPSCAFILLVLTHLSDRTEHHRPGLSEHPALFMLAEYFEKLGSPMLRRRIAEKIPSKDFQQLKSMVDIMYEQSCAIFQEKKQTIEKGDEAVSQQLGEQKDIMSILREPVST